MWGDYVGLFLWGPFSGPSFLWWWEKSVWPSSSHTSCFLNFSPQIPLLWMRWGDAQPGLPCPRWSTYHQGRTHYCFHTKNCFHKISIHITKYRTERLRSAKNIPYLMWDFSRHWFAWSGLPGSQLLPNSWGSTAGLLCWEACQILHWNAGKN